MDGSEGGFSFQSTWISRFFNNKQGGASGSLRRCFSCSSVPSQGESELLAPRAFKRSQVVDYEDEIDDESLQRFLLSTERTGHCSSPFQQLRRTPRSASSSPKRSRPVSVSLDRSLFISSGSCCKMKSGTESVPRRLRGFETDNWTFKLDTDAPLPYSSFEDQQSGRKVYKPRPRKAGLARDSGDSHRTVLASLLTQTLTPIQSWQSDEGSCSSNSGMFLREHQMRRRSSKRNDEFVHEESVLSRPTSKQQQQQQQLLQQYQLQPLVEWINRWSVPGDESCSEANLLRWRAAHNVPSVEAMAIVGKSSMNVHPNSSWSNSITYWQSEAGFKPV